MIELNFVKLIEGALKDNWSLPMFTNYGEGKTYTSADVARQVAKVHLMLSSTGLERGDKVVLVAKDSAEWCMVWVGIVTYGCVVVPILPEFHGDSIRNIIHHSDAKAVFAGKEHIRHLDADAMPGVKAVFGVKDLTPISSLTSHPIASNLNVDDLFSKQYPKGFDKSHIQYPEISNDSLMVISYTSGTSGFSKGVMTTANNLAANIKVTLSFEQFERGKSILSFIPNAHAYGCAFNFLLALIVGCHVYILGAKPVPSLLLKAFKDVRPHMILTVPLVLEKIYKNVIVPKIDKPAMKLALKIPGLNRMIYRKIGKALEEALGGNLKGVIIGGAALNREVDQFLSKAKFPYTVGYGMTECAPLMAYSYPHEFVVGSCGKILDMIEEVRISESHEENGFMVGEVQVRGENVCKGYYKESKLTEELFTADGWMRTGDLGYLDKSNNLFLRGRSKSMILGPNGQNIYPEEIEAKIAMLPYMSEAIVVARSVTSIVAIVTLDKVALKRDGKDNDEAIKEILKENKIALNQSISSFAAISNFEVLDEEFQKTPKQSIKRYLYE